MTELKVVQSAIAHLDPKGDIPEINMALYIVSVAREKEYTDYIELVDDATELFEKCYGYTLE